MHSASNNISRVQSEEETLAATVFPNPTVGNSTLRIVNATSPVNFKLFDSTGRKVSEKQNMQDGDYELNTHFPEGIYYYTLTGEKNNVFNGKIIIQQ